MSKDNGKKFLLGAALGAMAGAVAGILFAPKSGKETRKIIVDKAKEYGDKGKDALEQGKDVFEQGKEIAKEKIKETADDISKKMGK